MPIQATLQNEPCGQTDAYVLGILEEPELSRFEEHLGGCQTCQDELDEHQGVMMWLALSATPVAPPRTVRTRLFEQIAREPVAMGTQRREEPAQAQVWKSWSTDQPAPGGIHYVPSSDSAWEPTPFKGVEVRRLSVDTVADRVTMLVRMSAGSSYVPHRHHGTEECFVISGDLRVGETHMRMGDYQRAAGGSVHDVQSTDEGCELLIVSSMRDELLESSAV